MPISSSADSPADSLLDVPNTPLDGALDATEGQGGPHGPHMAREMVERLQARLLALRAERELARATYLGECFDCQDTGRISDRPCTHCARGRAVARHERAAWRAAQHDTLFAQGGVPRRRWRQTFATFPDQESKTLAMLRAFASSWDGEEGLLLTGAVGVGKTGLVVALLNAICTRYVPALPHSPLLPESTRYARTLAFVTAVDLIDALRAGQNDGSYARVLARAKDVRLLVLDDLGVEIPTEWVRERLFSIINHRYEHCLPTIVTSNYGAEQLEEHLSTRVLQRLLETCAKIEMSGHNLRAVGMSGTEAEDTHGD